jgi:hypothetical protein
MTALHYLFPQSSPFGCILLSTLRLRSSPIILSIEHIPESCYTIHCSLGPCLPLFFLLVYLHVCGSVLCSACFWLDNCPVFPLPKGCLTPISAYTSYFSHHSDQNTWENNLKERKIYFVNGFRGFMVTWIHALGSMRLGRISWLSE